ncbi:MAG TPA: AraC family ligand binding domain-containing protein [Vicinamibacterales bacterium]|jgi:quercetin dioxygenase-like cupin family protein|nr:AraC family ligand binding domain-containing protein [Vicinamibacterales bacterium]
MSTTHIDTNSIPRIDLNAQGEVAEILNKQLCGAENVVGALRWLAKGERFPVSPLADTHQLIYLMEGEGVIELDKKRYDVKKGAGIYLGPSETASISHSGSAQLKLFHLIVPKKADR